MKRKTLCREPCEQTVLDALEPHLIPDIALLVLSYTEQATHPVYTYLLQNPRQFTTHTLHLKTPCARGCTKNKLIQLSAIANGEESVHGVRLDEANRTTTHALVDPDIYTTDWDFEFRSPREAQEFPPVFRSIRCRSGKGGGIFIRADVTWEYLHFPKQFKTDLVQKYMSLFG
jgi:hypothetical protein